MVFPKDTDVLETTKNNSLSFIPYMPQLDTLRTIAIAMVLFEHWLPAGIVSRIIPFGMLGVTLFFVLSGFLITLILLQSKLISEEMNTGIFHSLKQFYIRRTLRIFPIYYFTIIILLILNIENIRAIYPWFIFYASNIYFYLIHNWAGSISHLWTLAVEEQFYIIWPVIILFTPKKYLFKVITGIILIGPFTRAFLFSLSDKTDMTAVFIHILTPTCMDCFGLGAILAYYRIFVDKAFVFKSRNAMIFFVLNILSIIILLMFDESIFSMFFFRFNVSLIFLFLIAKVSVGFTGVLKSVFENKTLMYLGKISYGLYLFHNFIPMIYSSLSLPPIHNSILRFFVMSAILIFISSLSWFLIEKPINNLKKRFAYQ